MNSEHTAYYITTLPTQQVQSRKDWIIISPLTTSVIALVTYWRYVAISKKSCSYCVILFAEVVRQRPDFRVMSPLNGSEYQTVLNLSSTPNETCVSSAESSTLAQCIKTFAYSLIMFLSLFGNLAVIAIVSKNNRMWTTTNFLIANMAASDLMITAFALPREVAEVFIGPRRWLLKGIMGQVLCKLVSFIQDLSTAVSMHSLVVIAIDRYRGIVFPFRSPVITTKNCKVIIPIIWVVAMGLHGMYFYTLQLTMSESKWYCTISWAPKFEEKTQVIYFTFLSVVIIFLPLCVILTLYTLILIELRKRKVSKNNALELRSRRRKEDTAIMKRILILVLLFILCITPVIVSGLVFHFTWHSLLPCDMEHLFPVTKFVFYSNASLNPWVYIVLSERYRQGMKELAKNFTCKDKIGLKRASNLSLRKTDKKPKAAVNFVRISSL